MPHQNPFAPANRLATSLPVLRIEVEHAGGVEVFVPNSMIMTVLMAPERLLELEPIPTRGSDISLEPAVLYRSDDLEVALTPEELVRLAGHALTPDDYFALRNRYGMAYEWHEDFYDPETGEALQPVGG